ncbi:MAG: hypothetical protein IKP40_12090 [Clostridia bacterium]|nr:hypothetical protein [Clostridia bacterium]
MDKVFREEEAKLKEIEGMIDQAAKKSSDDKDSLAREIADFHPVDYADVALKKDLLDRYKRAAVDSSRLLELKPCPYFGRLDLDREIGDQYELNTYYIGKKGLTLGSNVVIVDWRTPVGECYYAQNQTSFSIKGIIYSLALRRALNIQNAKLISYRTEFDGNKVSLKGDVIDPFLLTVLQDKRRQNRLTDIIRSIQANQNEIIRRPLQENFIVQGCAGSGKTMILLHRLSYLKFNYRRMPLSGVKIITPNPDFSAHINELSSELDLDTIAKFTVEEYYVDLINRYARNPNITAVVSSESTLKPGLLGEIYSIGFMSQLREQYHAYWAAVLEAVDEPRLKACFLRHRIDYPSTGAHDTQTASALDTALARIIQEFQEKTSKYQEALKQKAELEEACRKTAAFHRQAAEAAAAARIRLFETLSAEQAACADRMAQISSDIQPSRARLQKLKESDAGVSDRAERAERELASIREKYDSYTDYDRLASQRDTIGISVSSACESEIARIRDLDAQIQRTPGYNFVKRGALRRQLQEAQEDFSAAAKARLDAMIAEREKAQSAFSSTVQAQRKEMVKLSQAVGSADHELGQLQRRQNALNECISKLAAAAGENHALVLSSSAHDELADDLVGYERAVMNLDMHSNRLAEIQKRIALFEEQSQPPFDEDRDYLKACETEIARLKPVEVYRQVVRKTLTRVYSRHGEEYTRTNYRHKLFLMLLFCSWYFRRLSSPDTYLNIDEAQDLSVAEYTLLREILGNSCVFNLYGDINQSLFPDKSITDWEDLRKTVSGKVFVLNEDYRNTHQITEYCNQEFYAEIFPIGIKGEPVSEMDSEQALRWLVELKRENPAYRAAIIVHRDSPLVNEHLSAVFSGKEVSWYAVDDNKISVLTVEHAKGLEFEAVVVLCAGMEINEQYIAYTRALDHLCVVKG